MSAIETKMVTKEQKPGGANGARPGKMPAGFSKSGSPDDFIGMMQLTMAEYHTQNQKHTGENDRDAAALEHRMARLFSFRSNRLARENGTARDGEAADSSVDAMVKHAGADGPDGEEGNTAMAALVSAFIKKISVPAPGAGGGAEGADSLPWRYEEGMNAPVAGKNLLVHAVRRSGGAVKIDTSIIAAPVGSNVLAGEGKPAAIPEIKVKQVAAPAAAGSTPAGSPAADPAEARAAEMKNAAPSLPAMTENRQLELLAAALEGEGIPKEAVAGIIRELHQALTAGAENDRMRTGRTGAADRKEVKPDRTITAERNVRQSDRALAAGQDGFQPEMTYTAELNIRQPERASNAGQDKAPPDRTITAELNVRQPGRASTAGQDGRQPEPAAAGQEVLRPQPEAAAGHDGVQPDRTITAELKLQQPELASSAGQNGRQPEPAASGQEVGRTGEESTVSTAPTAKQDAVGKNLLRPDQPAPSFRQATVAILAEKGFTDPEITAIMNTVEEGAADAGFPRTGRPSPDREILAQGEAVQKELNREARLDRKKIHGDIYKKEASMDKFGRENIEARMKINPPDRNIDHQDVNIGTQAEGLEDTGNPRPRELKNALAGSLKEPGLMPSAAVGKDIKAGNVEKPHILAGQDDHGAARGAASEATGKKGKGRQEDGILPPGREPARIHADHLAMTTKAADFQPAKTGMDTTKSIYQSVVDQIREGISLSAGKDGGQVRLNLKPESMGQLDMRIAVRNESVQIIMTVENEKVHQAMNAHIDDLKTALQNQGLKVDKIEVALQYQPGHEGSFHREEANYRFNPGQNGHQGRLPNQEPAFGDDRYPHPGQEVVTAPGGAEGVSIFA